MACHGYFYDSSQWPLSLDPLKESSAAAPTARKIWSVVWRVILLVLLLGGAAYVAFSGW